LLDALAHGSGELVDERLDEERDVLSPFAQRRNEDGKYVEAIVVAMSISRARSRRRIFQHWWREGLRSTWTYGYVRVNNLEIQTPDSLHETRRWTANLAWSPILRIDLVFEYLAGIRKNKDGESGFSDQIQIGGTFRF
jgi:hypothetical protein